MSYLMSVITNLATGERLPPTVLLRECASGAIIRVAPENVEALLEAGEVELCTPDDLPAICEAQPTQEQAQKLFEEQTE